MKFIEINKEYVNIENIIAFNVRKGGTSFDIIFTLNTFKRVELTFSSEDEFKKWYEDNLQDIIPFEKLKIIDKYTFRVYGEEFKWK